MIRRARAVDAICWPTVAPSSIEYYSSEGKKGIPGWDQVLLVTTLKRGSLYVLPLTRDGKHVAGHFSRYFQSVNRYRDLAVGPDLRTIYIATDNSGMVEALEGGPASAVQNPGSILVFTYVGEGTGAVAAGPSGAGMSGPSATATATRSAGGAGSPPQFTADQAATGKSAFQSNCAVCHGNTLTNGTFAPPLGGEYFHTKWGGQTVGAFYDHAHKMPPAAPDSLPDETYADIVAYVLELNGSKPGDTRLPAGGAALEQMTIQ